MGLLHLGAAAALGLAVAGPAGPAGADEIADEIRSALKLYEEGKTVEAKDALEFAAQLLAQKKAGGLEAFFPKPLDGWSVEDSSMSAGAAPFGGGITAAKTYVKDDETVEIAMIGDSPMMQGLAMMFGNPALAGSSGAKMQRIKGQRALIKDGEIQILAGKFFVTISGSAPEAAKLRYAEAIPFDALSKF